MTSFTKALYRRDPAAAEAFHRAQQFEHKVVYGKSTMLACFTPTSNKTAGFEPAHNPVQREFGRRPQPPHSRSACTDNCGHPGCSNGCIAR